MPRVSYLLPASAPTAWLHVTKPHVMGELVMACFGGEPPAGLVLSESSDDADAAALRPLLAWFPISVSLSVVADLDADGASQAIAAVEAARAQGRRVRVVGIGDTVVGDATIGELAPITIPQQPAAADQASAAAACAGGCWGPVSLEWLRTGRTVELEGVVNPAGGTAAAALRSRLVEAIRLAAGGHGP